MAEDSDDFDLREDLTASIQEYDQDYPDAPDVEDNRETFEDEDSGPDRDEYGRFKAKGGPDGEPDGEPDEGLEERATEDPEQSEGEEPTEEGKPEPIKAPASLSPAARQVWDKVPEEVQREVMRRESEINNALQQTATARRVMQTVEGLGEKYSASISSAGVDLVTAADTLLDADFRLRFEQNPRAKAAFLADIIKNYNVDIRELDAVLSGRVKAGDLSTSPQPQQQPMGDPRFDQFLSQLESERQRLAAQGQQQVAQTVQEFLTNPRNQFANDVRLDMADLIDAANARGEELSIEEAYDRACWARPDIRQILTQQMQAKRSQNRPTDSARRAAKSVKSSPSGQPRSSSGGDSLRDDLLNAVNENL